MEVREIIQKLGYHHRAIAVWKHVVSDLSTYMASSDGIDIIPVDASVGGSKASESEIKEVLNMAQEKIEEHENQVEELNSISAPLKLAEARRPKDSEESD